MHGSCGKESCQAGTLNHENKLHKSFTRHLFYVPAIHRTSGLMSEYLIQSDNCLGRRKAAGFSHREKKIQNKYTAVDEQKHLNQSHTYPSAQMQKRIHNRKINKPKFLRMVNYKQKVRKMQWNRTLRSSIVFSQLLRKTQTILYQLPK